MSHRIHEHGEGRVIRCPSCGTDNEPGDRFCHNCGADIRRVQSTQRPEPIPPPPPPSTPAPHPFAPPVGSQPPFGERPGWPAEATFAEAPPRRRRSPWVVIPLGCLALCMLSCILFIALIVFTDEGQESWEDFQTEVVELATEEPER